MRKCKLSELLLEAKLAKTEDEALQMIPEVTLNGHDVNGMANPVIYLQEDLVLKWRKKEKTVKV